MKTAQNQVPDVKTSLAIVLCVLVAFAYNHLVLSKYQRESQREFLVLQQQQEEALRRQAPSAPPKAAGEMGSETAPTTAAPADAPPQSVISSSGAPSIEEVQSAASAEVVTPLYRARLSSLGGRLLSFALTNFHPTVKGEAPLDLVNVVPGSEFPLSLSVGTYRDTSLPYDFVGNVDGQKQRANDKFVLGTNDVVTLVFTGEISSELTLRKEITLRGDSYTIGLRGSLNKPVEGRQPLWLGWSSFIPENLRSARLDPTQLLSLDTQEDLNTLQLTEVTGTKALGEQKWASIGSKYFLTAVTPEEEESNFRITANSDQFLLEKSGSDTEVAATIYAGPKKEEQLKEVGHSLHRAIDLGFFAVLSAPLLWVLHFLFGLLGNYGLAIILLTLGIKLLFLPLTRKSFSSMSAMQEIQPEVQALRERVKDPTQLNQELMALYKKKGVNPLGGCLPILIQLPVFLGLYNGLLQSIELRHQPFALWINDLSSPERLMIMGVPIPLMIILMGISMMLQQWTQPSAGMDPTQRRVMMLMPAIFTGMFIIFPMPAGLVLYWLVNNLISIVQQMYLRGHRKANPIVATVLASTAIFVFGFILTLIPS